MVSIKRSCIVLLAVMLCCASVHAAAEGAGVLGLSFNGSTASCGVSVSRTGADIDVAMKLYLGANLVKVWYGSGSGRVSLSKTWPCISGNAYTLKADVTADVTPISLTPVTKICP